MLSNHDVINSPDTSFSETLRAAEVEIYKQYRSVVEDKKEILLTLPGDKWAQESIKIMDDLMNLFEEDKQVMHFIRTLEYLFSKIEAYTKKLNEGIAVYQEKFKPTTDVVFRANVNTCNQLVVMIASLTKMVSSVAITYETEIMSYDSIVKKAIALRDKYIAIEDRIKFQAKVREGANFRKAGFTPVGIMSHSEIINSILETFEIVTSKLLKEFTSDGRLERFSKVVSDFARNYIQHLAVREQGISVAKDFSARVTNLKKTSTAAMHQPASSNASIQVGITTTPANR